MGVFNLTARMRLKLCLVLTVFLSATGLSQMGKQSKSDVADFFMNKYENKRAIPISQWQRRHQRRHSSMERRASGMGMLGQYGANPKIAQAQDDFVNCYESMGDTETCWSLVKPQVNTAFVRLRKTIPLE